MANAPNLRVRITADLTDIKQGLGLLRGELNKVQAQARKTESGFSSMGKTIAGFAGAYVGLNAIVGGLKAVLRATVESEASTAKLDAKLKALGGSAIASKAQVEQLADSLQAATTFDDEAIRNAATSLLSFTRIDPSQFGRALKASLDLAAASGDDLSAVIDKVGKALNDPVNSMRALKDAGIALDDNQKALVKSLVETGRQGEAQNLILAELEKRYKGTAEAARNTLGGALKGLENDFENVLEGDSGGAGVKGMTESINELSATLRSPETKAGFQAVIQGLGEIATYAVKAIAAVGGLGNALADLFRKNADKSYDGLLSRRVDVVDKLASGAISRADAAAGITMAKLRAELVEIDALISRQTGVSNGRVFSTGATVGRRSGANGAGNGIRVTAPADAAADTATATTATNKHAAAMADADRAAKLYADALADVNNVLRDQAEAMGGPALQAAFAYKDQLDKLATAEQVLRDGGKLDEDAQNRLAVARQQALDAYQAKLGEIEKAERGKVDTLATLEQRLGDITSRLQGGETSISTQAEAGLLPQTTAEEQLQDLRGKSIAQMKQLRIDTIAAMAAMSGPEAERAVAFLQQIDGSIAQVDLTMNQFKLQVKDQAAQSLTAFFSDLALGAKSFKDAFLDMVRSFVAGIIKMIAQKLALKAVDAIFAAFHSGGIAGAGGSLRAGINPMVFGFAPRYHSGGLAGLAPDEVPAILQRGEEVLTRKDARHRANGGAAAVRGQSVKTVVLFSEEAVAEHMISSAGERAILTVIGKNRGRVRESIA